MPKTDTVHPTSPGANGMEIIYQNALDFRGQGLASAIAPPVLLTVRPKLGAASPARLSSVGMVAMVAAVNTHIAGLSAANRDAIATQLPGGLTCHIEPGLITVPCHAAGIATLAAALQAVLATGANVVTLTTAAA